jgi:hypothetical protein
VWLVAEVMFDAAERVSRSLCERPCLLGRALRGLDGIAERAAFREH